MFTVCCENVIKEDICRLLVRNLRGRGYVFTTGTKYTFGGTKKV